MNPLEFRLSARLLIAASVLPALAGCHGVPPSTDLNASASAISGIESAIEFKTEGEPIDVSGSSDQLTVQAAIQAALRHDPEIQIRLARVRAALADARQARLLPNPILSVVFRFPEGGGSPEIEAGLAADLLAFLQMRQKTSAADNRLRVASADAMVAVLDTLAAVQEKVIAVQAAEAEAAVIGHRNELVARLLDLTKSRVEAGEASRLDILALDAQRVEAEAELIEIRAKQIEYRLGLARSLGQPSSAAKWPIEPLATQPFEVHDERPSIEAALSQRPEIHAVQWELAALGEDLALHRWWWSDRTEIGVDGERDGDWAIGPAASAAVPIFDWGTARREKASAAQIEARHRLTQVRRQVVEEVRQAFAARSASAALLAKIQEELLPLAQRRLDQAEAQYRAGETNVASMLQAEQQLLSTRSKFIQSQQNLRRAEVRLERAVGKRATR